MITRRWLMVSGLAGIVPVAWFGTRINAQDPRITDSRFEALEEAAGHRLYAPTWLPYDMKLDSTMRGPSRVVSLYGDPNICMLGVAQERRNPVRDEYHKKTFVKKATETCMVGARSGYFVRGPMGETRLFFFTDDTALILSSHRMKPEEMITVAEGLR